MNAVDELLSRFIAEHRARGDADPAAFLDGVTGTDRVELAVLIDRYLAEAAPRPFDPEAFARFRGDPRRHAMVARVLDDATLKALRLEAQLSKQGVGAILSDGLGLSGHEQRVKARYHDMEIGSVDPARVRRRVWEVLAQALGASLDRVREAAGSSFATRPGGEAALVFARTGEGGPADAATAGVADDAEALVDRVFFVD